MALLTKPCSHCCILRFKLLRFRVAKNTLYLVQHANASDKQKTYLWQLLWGNNLVTPYEPKKALRLTTPATASRCLCKFDSWHIRRCTSRSWSWCWWAWSSSSAAWQSWGLTSSGSSTTFSKRTEDKMLEDRTKVKAHSDELCFPSVVAPDGCKEYKKLKMPGIEIS